MQHSELKLVVVSEHLLAVCLPSQDFVQSVLGFFRPIKFDREFAILLPVLVAELFEAQGPPENYLLMAVSELHLQPVDPL
jgi:hypothetical protein